MSDETAPDIKIAASFYPEDQGSLRTVMLGLGRPAVLIEPVADPEENEITLELSVSGLDRHGLVELFELLAETLAETPE